MPSPTPVLLAVAAVAALSVPTAAVASRGADTGQPCGATITAAVDQHFNRKTAVVHGGPWLAVDHAAPAPGLARDVQVTCEAELSTAACYDSGNEFFRASSTPSSGVTVLSPARFDFFDAGTPIYLGTTVTWTYVDGSTSVRHVDADPGTAGDQCARVYDGNEA